MTREEIIKYLNLTNLSPAEQDIILERLENDIIGRLYLEAVAVAGGEYDEAKLEAAMTPELIKTAARQAVDDFKRGLAEDNLV